jgi:glycosyltransferase involved in cell wall biosynthesis
MSAGTSLRVALAGPADTDMLRRHTGLALSGAPEHQGGPPVTALAVGLLAAGVELTLVTLSPGLSAMHTIREGRLTIHYCPMRRRARTRMLDLFETESRGIEQAIRAAAPDFVHAHWTYEYAEGAVRSRVPHLVTMHDIGWDNLWLYRDPYRLVRLLMKLRVMPRLRHLSVVAPFMARKPRHYGYRGPVTVIPNGVFVPPIDEGAILERARRAPVFVTIGNPSRRKNVRLSLAAFEHIRQQRPDARLHLFGPGLDGDFAGAHPGVEAHGKVPHDALAAFLRTEATAIIHPSLQECCPMIVAEAKALALPCVGGEKSGGVPFVCGTDAGCTLVDITDPAAIATAALESVADAGRYAENARRAHADALARFDNPTITARYLAAYEAALAGPRGGTR